ncbi:MAG: GTP-binding protein [Rhodospirillales bacterium]|nr:GTP-binding protein [Rhodospirillales bacterium]
MSRILVTIITGFLGSGKTTLLNALLKHPDMSEAAVIVNEFGEIGLDYDLVERSDESVIQLENGCLCCTVKSDLIDTFRDLHLMRLSGDVPKFNRVIIETTGIADPGPVLQIILTDPLVSSCYALDAVVTTVDAINGASSLDRFPECVKQAAIAERIVLTKTDLLEGSEDKESLKALKDRLLALNPGVDIIEAMPSNINPSDLFGAGMFNPETKKVDLQAWLRPEAYENRPPQDPNAGVTERDQAALDYYRDQGHSPEVEHAHDPAIRSFCFVRDMPTEIETLRLFLDALTRESGPDLLRVKGIVNVVERPDTPAVIQGAQQIFHSLEWLEKWPSDDRRTRIVFITRGIDQAHIEDTFELIERIAARTTAAAAGAY